MRLILLSAMLLSLSAEGASDDLSPSERRERFQESGMGYAADLWQGLDGSPEDEVKTRAGDALNYKIRDRAIRETEAVIAKRKDPSVRKDLLKRLASLHEQQSAVAARRSDLPNKDLVVKNHLHAAIRNLETLKREFPHWKADVVLFGIAENWAALGNLSTAERYYQEVIARFSTSPILADTLLSMGNLQFEKQRFSLARANYKKIFLTPERNLHPFAHYKIAWAFFNEQDTNSAVASLEAAVLESRRLQAATANRKLGVEDEALTDMVLFFAEAGRAKDAEETFNRLVDGNRARELRFSLARRLYDHGKHALSKQVAQDLLGDKPLPDQVNKLYLIVMNSAERMNDRGESLQTAEKLTSWIKEQKLTKEDTGRIETEEYLRHYSQKLHYEAETLKKKELWGQAERSYEIYLDTFQEDTEAGEVKFRYAVLLMHQKNHAKAWSTITAALGVMDAKHKRHYEAMKLRIQSIEFATKKEREKIGEVNLILAYDQFAKAYPDDKLAVEAEFKAANIARSVEGPEKASSRFRSLAERNSKHDLAKEAVAEGLSILVKAERWESLREETKAFRKSEQLASDLFSKNSDLSEKLKSAEELALVKIAETQEKAGQWEAAAKIYDEYASASEIPEKIRLHSLIRLADIQEQKIGNFDASIANLRKIQDLFPLSKEGQGANLEVARIYEKTGRPRLAAEYYLRFGGEGKGKKELQALINAVSIQEGLGLAADAADLFFRISSLQPSSKDAQDYYQAGCTNTLIATAGKRESKLLERILECSERLKRGPEALAWTARKAWALEQLKRSDEGRAAWIAIANSKFKSAGDSERIYIAQAGLRALEDEFNRFTKIRFAEKNEKPAANLQKKTQALDGIERSVKRLLGAGSKRQVVEAQKYVKLAYLDFAETMESAATPSKLSDQEQAELKKAFQGFAQDFRAKAEALEVAVDSALDRAPASDMAEAKKELLAGLPKLDTDALKKVLDLISKKTDSPEAWAQYAAYRFDEGDYAEARYYLNVWKKLASGKKSPLEPAMENLQNMLEEKVPTHDPVVQDLI